MFLATFSKDACKVAGELGIGLEINDLCISGNLDEDKREWVIQRIEREIEEGRSNNNIMHGPFTELTPAAIDHKAIELMDERYDATIEICKHFGINDLVLHDGYIPLMYHKSWHIKKSIEFWRRLSDRLPDDMTVYVENVFDDEPETLMEIIESVSRDNIKICLDIGHANCMTIEEYPVTEWIRIMAPYLGHFHLHNNDGTGDQHCDVFDGLLNINSVIGMIEDCCDPEVTFTIESRDARPSAEYLLNNL